MSVVVYLCRYWVNVNNETFSVPQNSETESRIIEFLDKVGCEIPPTWLDVLEINLDSMLEVRWVCHPQNEFRPRWEHEIKYAFPEYRRAFDELIESLRQLV